MNAMVRAPAVRAIAACIAATVLALASPPFARATTAPADDAPAHPWTRATARAYLAEHRAAPGVVQTRSGLQYRVLAEGTGCRPKKGSDVRVQYTLRQAGDDAVIDDSRTHGGPQAVSLAGMIPAWQEGIPLMREGATWEFTVPPALAYGAKGLQGSVPPNAVLVFVVELVAAGTCTGASQPPP